MTFTDFLKLFPLASKEWVRDRADGLGASIAYYQLMSIPPYIALLIISASAIFGDERTKTEIIPVIAQFIHPQFVTAIRYMLSYSFSLDEVQLFTITNLAIISLVHGTLGYFAQIKDAIETFWNERTERVSTKEWFRKQEQAVLMAAVIFVFLLAGFILSYFIKRLEMTLWPVQIMIEVSITFAIVFFIFKYCPPVKVNWRDIIPGAIITTLLYLCGRLALKYILENQQNESEDVAAALIMYLLWAYYSSLIFLYGAEFNKLYIEKKRGIDVNRLTF